MSEKAAKITMTIDGREVNATSGARLLDVAASVGVEIPHFCYHPQLSNPADCGMCRVHIEGEKDLQTACNTFVEEGMNVQTRSDEVLEALKETMTEKLTGHPLDCPVCDKAGECALQNYAESLQLSGLSIPKIRRNKPKSVIVGPTLVLDGERCIQCSRCVRFSEEIAGDKEFVMLPCDGELQLTVKKEVTHPYSTNLADICPVGALTQRDFRTKRRVWSHQQVQSVCPECARGCNIILDCAEGEVQRIRPGHNDAVNQCWMCDAGRVAYRSIASSYRLKMPLVSLRGKLEEVSWQEAFDYVAGFLEEGQDRLASQLSALASNEDNYTMAALLSHLHAPAPASLPQGPDGWEDVEEELLRRSDRTPNRMGAEVFSGARPFVECLDGASTALILHENVLPEPRIHRSLRHVIYLGTHMNATARAATIVLPVTLWAEQTGSFTNFEGRVQRFFQGVEPPSGVLPAWKVFVELLQMFGGKRAQRVDAVFNMMSRETEFFQGVTFASLGEKGWRAFMTNEED
ncbi:MAG: hypothetical protein CL920_02360 [Deltaproteobacteria bacterium]|nr:hypothetical protein [Deltaproteobacteria bacterium]